MSNRIASVRRLATDNSYNRRLAGTKNLSSSPTRKKAAAILQREAINVKKSKIHSFLIQQLVSQYGTRRPGTMVNKFINEAVNDYLQNNNDVDEQAIDALERFVQRGTEKIKQDKLSSRENAARQAEEAAQLADLERSVEAMGDSRRNSAKLDYSSEIDSAQWTTLNAISSIVGEEAEQAEKDLVNRRRMEYRRILDDHATQYEQRKAEEKAAERRAIQQQREAEERYNKKLDDSSDDLYGKTMSAKHMRLQQIAEKQARLQAEKDRKKQQEAAEIERTKALIEEDRLREIELKEQAARRNAATKAENERFKAIKAERARQEQLEEQRMQREAEARAQREQARRENEFKEKMDRQAKAMSRFADGAGAAAQAAREAEADLTASNMEKKYRADEEKERVKEEHRRREMQKSLIANQMIVDRKKQEAAEARAQDRALGERFRRERSEEEIQRAEDLRVKREKMRAMRSMLDDQMAIRAQGVKDEGSLTNLEANLNKDIIAKLKANPEFAKRVHDRVKPQTQYKSQGFIFA